MEKCKEPTIEEFFECYIKDAKDLKKSLREIALENLNANIEEGNFINLYSFENIKNELKDNKLWNGKYYGKHNHIVYINNTKYTLYV